MKKETHAVIENRNHGIEYTVLTGTLSECETWLQENCDQNGWKLLPGGKKYDLGCANHSDGTGRWTYELRQVV